MRQAAGEGANRMGRHSTADTSTLIPIVKRLEEAIKEETTALQSQNAANLSQLFQRKSQGLLELANAQRSLGGLALSEPARAAMNSLRQNLEANQDVLRLHLDAATELIEVFSQAVRDSESDGTYDAGYGRSSRK